MIPVRPAGSCSLALLALLALLVGCPTADEDPIEDVSAGLCTAGVLECPWGQGCLDGVCGGCADADDCNATLGCGGDGRCGACAGDGQCRDGEVCRHGSCMPETLPVWQLEVDPGDWAEIDGHPQEDLWVPCALSVDGIDYGAAELRLRGGSTRGFPKRSLRIEFPEDADHPGYARKINLRAEYNDPSYLRTVVGFEAFRRHSALPTPRARYLRLELNGDYYGLMVETERIGGRFLELRGRDRGRPLWEGYDNDPEGAFTPNDSDAEYGEFYERKTGDPADFVELRALIEEAVWLDRLDSAAEEGSVTPRIAEAVHVDGYLDYLALMAAVQSHDHITNNFYLSRQRVGAEGPAWEFYAADLDLSLGCLWDVENEDTICDDLQHEGWWMNGWIPDDVDVGTDPVWGNLLIHQVLTDPTIYPDYSDRLCAVVQGSGWNDDLPELIAAIRETIGPAVDEDSQDLNDDLGDLDAAQDEVIEFLDLRRDYLVGALPCE